MRDIGGHTIGRLARTHGAIEKLSHPLRMIRIGPDLVGIIVDATGGRHVSHFGGRETNFGRIVLKILDTHRLAIIGFDLGHANAGTIQVCGGGSERLDAGLVIVLGLQGQTEEEQTTAKPKQVSMVFGRVAAHVKLRLVYCRKSDCYWTADR